MRAYLMRMVFVFLGCVVFASPLWAGSGVDAGTCIADSEQGDSGFTETVNGLKNPTTPSFQGMSGCYVMYALCISSGANRRTCARTADRCQDICYLDWVIDGKSSAFYTCYTN